MEPESVLLEIRDFDLLNMLSRALVEAKFHAEPLDEAVPTSRALAELATEIADRVEQETARRYPSVHSLTDGWRDPSDQPEMLAVVRARLRECRDWEGWTPDERIAHVHVLLAPFHPLAAVVDELVAERDAGPS